eukprot:Skav220959  [mRNA]  locus=scaffold1928:156606:159268:+ [translate_table: standard]
MAVGSESTQSGKAGGVDKPTTATGVIWAVCKAPAPVKWSKLPVPTCLQARGGEPAKYGGRDADPDKPIVMGKCSSDRSEVFRFGASNL